MHLPGLCGLCRVKTVLPELIVGMLLPFAVSSVPVETVACGGVQVEGREEQGGPDGSASSCEHQSHGEYQGAAARTPHGRRLSRQIDNKLLCFICPLRSGVPWEAEGDANFKEELFDWQVRL